MKRIMLLTTGGTIASASSEEGLVPRLSADELRGLVPELNRTGLVTCRSLFSADSSNMQPEHWQTIARETYRELDEYDGVVIAHGTDTMAYTASALSFMLKNLDKPVVLTGSQLPLTNPKTDARRNILQAFQVAAAGYPGVFIAFNGMIIRGVRASKIRTVSFAAFESVNAPPAGRIQGNRVIMDTPGLPAAAPRQLKESLEPRVFLLKLIPGTRPEIITALPTLNYKGLVIESFGLGGVPQQGRDLLPAINQLLEAGMPVVVGTQCLYEGARFDVYQVGRKTARAGIIPAYDMTTEAAVTKLMWVLGQTGEQGEVRRMMLTDYCGEIKAPRQVD